MHFFALGAFWPKSGTTRFAMRLCSLNAPFGARCFLTGRRVAPPMTKGNVMSDRQWLKSAPTTGKHKGRISDLSLRLHVAPWTVCGAGDAPEIVPVTGV